VDRKHDSCRLAFVTRISHSFLSASSRNRILFIMVFSSNNEMKGFSTARKAVIYHKNTMIVKYINLDEAVEKTMILVVL